MEGTVYVLDANVFIEAARRYYAFDLVPGFWTSLVWHAERGRIRSIDRVKKELERGRDALSNWAKESFEHAFDSTDTEDTVKAYRGIISWVYQQTRFQAAAKAGFAKGMAG